MNKRYWEKFYKKFDIKTPSDFAIFCMKYIIEEQKPLIDIGCGNGRDTYYFSRNLKHKVLGIDFAVHPENNGAVFEKCNFLYIKDFGDHSVYSRFFIHSLENLEIIKLFEKVKGLLMLEFRHKGDIPLLYKHKRNLVDGRDIREILLMTGFKIKFYQVSRKLAIFKKEDPLICRIIAKRES